ncbi:hybrid sensor histidine kinase/response regulator (plasmid) [Azospirillum argentinense]|uniref:histidine kinase n=1 Tax=Azospirillum argentinense TaxID=2970906 RepID=A0A2K1FSD3_9PROT|nr:PAS domain S-box protein [Azospirillum argentinense]PNQ95446.1 hybrid sensor histidine kinase/response regulator [Azospirillum argentinense]
MSILTRLVLLVLLASLPAIGILAHNSLTAIEAGERQAEAEARRLLTLIQDEQQRVVEGMRGVLVTVAEMAPRLAIDPQQCSSTLNRLRGRLPRVKGIALTDLDGSVRCASDAKLNGLMVGTLPHIRMALYGQGFVVGDYAVRRLDGRPVLPFAAPYTDGAGRMAGVVSIALDAGWLREYLAEKPLPPNAMLVLADRNGTLLGRFPGSDDQRVGKPLPEPLMALLRAPSEGVAEMPGLDGEPRILAYAPVDQKVRELFLAVGLDRTEALRPVTAAAERSAFLLALAAALSLTAAWIGARLFVLRPVARLKRVVERWSAGDRNARIGRPGDRSEIGALGRAFDSMAQELQAREQARDAAHAAEHRMAAILAASTDAVVELDHEGHVTFANEKAARLFGDGGDLVGHVFVALLPPGVAEPFTARFRDALDRGEPEEFEIRLAGDEKRAGGDWYALRLFATGDRLAVYAQDVTRRKEDERAIRRAVERHRSLLETAADAILLVDAKGTVHTYNRGAERIFGHSPADAVGTDVGRLIPGGLVPEPLSPDRLADGVAREVEGRRRDGLAVPLELSLSAWSDGGDRFFTAILRDITERKRTESALRRAKDQAERANRAKSRFLAAASHDLRQPVQSLFFLTSALDEQTRGTPGHDTLKTMQQALEALKRLLDGLLDISKLDAGVVEPVTTTVAIQPLFERLAAEYAPEAARRGLTLRVVPTTLHARSDPMLLERVVRNLLDNALRYTGRGGVLLGVRRSRRRFHIAVCDSGAGIPPDRQEDIFEEFTQLGNPERDREKGLGLGLAIVRRLCALLGHSVALRSRPGSGSTFLVTVPAAEPPRPAVTTVPAVGRTEGGGCRLVLIIDDEVIILMGLRAMLEGWGYEVIAATAGDEAIRLLDEAGRRPDVILADYRLRHGKTGPEALRAIHAHCRAAIPSIILTGDTAPERIVEAQRSGFAILHKPVSSHHLKQVVAEAGGR